MNKRTISMITLSFSSIALAACSGSREVEIQGDLTAPSAVSGPIAVEFFDIAEEEETSVLRIELNGPGAFNETVEVEGEEVRIFALADADGDGACTEGEAWGELEAPVDEEDRVAPVEIALAVQACPIPTEPATEE